MVAGIAGSWTEWEMEKGEVGAIQGGAAELPKGYLAPYITLRRTLAENGGKTDGD